MDEKTVNQKIRDYLKIINTKVDTIDTTNKGLIDFCIDTVIDRVCLYLNSENIPTRVERILAEVVDTGLTKSLKKIAISNEDNTAVDQVVTSISDNGQSIAYSNEVRKYFTTASDEELFTGFSALLSRYRRVKVVYPKTND